MQHYTNQFLCIVVDRVLFKSNISRHTTGSKLIANTNTKKQLSKGRQTIKKNDRNMLWKNRRIKKNCCFMMCHKSIIARDQKHNSTQVSFSAIHM